MIGDDAQVKRCSKCGEVKPLEAFSKDLTRKDGLQYLCKACDRERAKARRAANPERVRAQSRARGKAYYEANREAIRAQSRARGKAYYEANREAIRERAKAWREGHSGVVRARNKASYAANRDARLEKNKASYAANRDARLEYRKAYYEGHRDAILENNKAWHEANRDARLEYMKAWRAANSESAKAAKHRRRARLVASPEHFTAADVRLQLRSQRNHCWHCGKKLGDDYHVDHLIPLARGGSNAPNNIVISCPNCNLRKHDKLTYEFNGRLF